MKLVKYCLASCTLFAALVLCEATALAQSTAVTWQGRLVDGAGPANGTYDLRFTLFDALSAGAQVGTPVTATSRAVNGLFTASLQFATGSFNGGDRWIEIGVRTNGSSAAYTTLSPRVSITSAPYAIYSPQAGTAATAGTATLASTVVNNAVTTASLADNSVTAIKLASDASSLAKVSAGLATANAGKIGVGTTTPASLLDVAGTITAQQMASPAGQPLILQAGGQVAWRATPTTGAGASANLIAGMSDLQAPVITSGVRGAVVAGGGAKTAQVYGTEAHRVTDSDGTIGGGFGNLVGNDNAVIDDAPFGTVGGGVFNAATGYAATVGGGDGNLAGGMRATVGGGYGNSATSDYATIPGGISANAGSYGQLAYASGGFASAGDAQSSIFVVRNATSSALNTELFLDGASKRISVPVNATWAFEALIVARVSDGTSIAWEAKGVIRNAGGVTSLVGNPSVTILGQNLISASVTPLADNTNRALVFQVSGVNAVNTRWVASVRTVEVVY
ncbi:MAG TPA: hypothetical protein VJA21_21120 [Verrucomicrobiae bacterium]